MATIHYLRAPSRSDDVWAPRDFPTLGAYTPEPRKPLPNATVLIGLSVLFAGSIVVAFTALMGVWAVVAGVAAIVDAIGGAA